MRIAFHPLNSSAEVEDGANLLAVLLANEFKVRSVCRGRGICASCRVSVRVNPGGLSPLTPQERKTISLVAGADSTTRLACQCRVVADGVTVALPDGLFVERIDDLLDLIGDRAEADYLHPVTGAVLIPKSKLITRTQISTFKNLMDDIKKVRD